MGFGKMVAASLGQKGTSTDPAATLKKLFLNSVETRDVPPPVASTCYRASGLYYICPREEVLAGVHKRSRKDTLEADTVLTFGLGTGMHHAMQNVILPPLKVIRGAWRCVACGYIWGKPEHGKHLVEVAMHRPDICNCGGTEFLYHEYTVQDTTYGVTGHMDGLLVLPGYAGMGLFELKSISEYGAEKASGQEKITVRKVPKADHVFQANVYMWLAGLHWAKLLYWIKGVYNADKALVEHTLVRDESLIQQAKDKLSQVRIGVKSGVLPDRICAMRLAKRAQDCPMLQECFGDPELDAGVGKF